MAQSAMNLTESLSMGCSPALTVGRKGRGMNNVPWSRVTYVHMTPVKHPPSPLSLPPSLPPSPPLSLSSWTPASSLFNSFANQTKGHYTEALTHLQTFRKYNICAHGEERRDIGVDAGIQ